MAIIAQLSWVLGFLVAVVAVPLAYAAAVFLGIVLAERRFARADTTAREQSNRDTHGT
jgi:hypothetical protein